MEKSNPEAVNALMNIIETFTYITIVFMFIFLFYFVKSEILGQKLERQQTIRALLFLFIGFAPNFIFSFVAMKNLIGLYVAAGIIVFALLIVSIKAIIKREYRIFGEIPFDKWFGIAFISMFTLNCALFYATIYKLYVKPANILFTIQNYGFVCLILASIALMFIEKLFKNIKIKFFLKWLQIPITSLLFASVVVGAFFMFTFYTAPAMDALLYVYSPYSRFVKFGKTEINTRAFGKEEIAFLENEINSGKDPKEIEREFLKRYTTFYKNNAE